MISLRRRMPHTSDVSERALETKIVQHLLDSGYVEGQQSDYDRALCLDVEQLFHFLEATQPDEVAKLRGAYKDDYRMAFARRVRNVVRRKGTLYVLRNTIRDRGAKLDLYYPEPGPTDARVLREKYESNRWSVTRQLRFSERAPTNQTRPGLRSLDVVLFVNGLPVVTMELKNQLTTQNVHEARSQYKDRDASEPLFRFKRCLVHFAADDNLAYMTTELEGDDTFFLPFNKGQDKGAGNPPNPDGLKTAYLWEDVLQPESMTTILDTYAGVIEEKKRDGSTEEKLFFPRYHQRDTVRLLVRRVLEDGVGSRYLVQHSTGSGKTLTITWLAFHLLNLACQDGTPVFDQILVVSDRRHLDRNIRQHVRQFAQASATVKTTAGGSHQLQKALDAQQRRIIVSTIQKFPEIYQNLGDLSDQRYAILIDEAHSSQGGSFAAAMNMSLGADFDSDATVEDVLNQLVENRKMPSNASFFAFTATPKNKTLELFGEKNEQDGRFYPTHLYSMKQAIEEEFILDVLKHYTTYQDYKELVKTSADDPRVDRSRAHRKLKHLVDHHPEAVEQRAKIMVDHFLNDVVRQKKLGGKARAMVVTKNREMAVRFKWAFDVYLRELEVPYEALVAFSGSKTMPEGGTYTDTDLNGGGIRSDDIPEVFREESKYRWLIVAEQYQTGYDEPLLHSMYVDKTLTGVNAVQTLSRLNRQHPDKEEVFVLDFRNSVDTVESAFETYYTATILSRETDPNKLANLEMDLRDFQVYTEEEVDTFSSRYLNQADRDDLDPILDRCVERYRDLNASKQTDFKAKARSFKRSYPFLAQIITFTAPEWERLFWFLKYLLLKLPPLNDEDLAPGVRESVDMDTYRVQKQATHTISLSGQPGEVDPSTAKAGGGSSEPDMEYLSQIVHDFNERFGHHFETEQARDRARRTVVEDLPNEIEADDDVMETLAASDQQNARITMEKEVWEKMQNLFDNQFMVYKLFTDNPDFREFVKDEVFRIVYEKILEREETPS